MPKFCPYCGSPTKENDKFCILCGKPMLTDVPKASKKEARVSMHDDVEEKMLLEKWVRDGIDSNSDPDKLKKKRDRINKYLKK